MPGLPRRASAVRPTILVLAGLLAASLACNTLLPASPAAQALPAGLPGDYRCSGHEAGLLAGAGFLTLREDGTADYEDFNGDAYSGAFTFDEASASLTFDPGLPFELATLAGDGSLALTVRPGLTLPHAESGAITCSK